MYTLLQNVTKSKITKFYELNQTKLNI